MGESFEEVWVGGNKVSANGVWAAREGRVPFGCIAREGVVWVRVRWEEQGWHVVVWIGRKTYFAWLPEAILLALGRLSLTNSLT